MDNIFGFMVHEKPVEAYFTYAKAHGLTHLEIDLIRRHSLLKTFSEDRIARIREGKAIHGISLSLHLPYTLNFSKKLRFSQKANLKYFKEAARLAERLDIQHITAHLGNFPASTLWADLRRIYLDRVITSLRGLIAVAQDHNLCLAIENIIPMPFGSGYFFLGDNINDFEIIFSKLDSQALGFCLDIGHANLSEGVMQYIKKLGDKLTAVHFHDNRGRTDEHLLVGQGTVPWQAAISRLKKLNFPGPYISECLGIPPHTANKELQKFFA